MMALLIKYYNTILIGSYEIILLMSVLMLMQTSCSSSSTSFIQESTDLGSVNEQTICKDNQFNYDNQKGCDGKLYPNPKDSPYIVPFPPETSFKTGLTNCSSSYHSAQYPDRYAFDFDVDEGTNFYAARGGTVVYVKEDQSSFGGGTGNLVVIDHDDNTFGIYLHSPKDGISVDEGDSIERGQLLGVTGKSGLAGYPHLHLVVVQNNYLWPYDSVPITFNNIVPADVIVKSNAYYNACKN